VNVYEFEESLLTSEALVYVALPIACILKVKVDPTFTLQCATKENRLYGLTLILQCGEESDGSSGLEVVLTLS